MHPAASLRYHQPHSYIMLQHNAAITKILQNHGSSHKSVHLTICFLGCSSLICGSNTHTQKHHRSTYHRTDLHHIYQIYIFPTQSATPVAGLRSYTFKVLLCGHSSMPALDAVELPCGSPVFLQQNKSS